MKKYNFNLIAGRTLTAQDCAWLNRISQENERLKSEIANLKDENEAIKQENLSIKTILGNIKKVFFFKKILVITELDKNNELVARILYSEGDKSGRIVCRCDTMQGMEGQCMKTLDVF